MLDRHIIRKLNNRALEASTLYENFNNTQFTYGDVAKLCPSYTRSMHLRFLEDNVIVRLPPKSIDGKYLKLCIVNRDLKSWYDKWKRGYYER